MARPPAHELTGRELEVMHVFWRWVRRRWRGLRDARAVGAGPGVHDGGDPGADRGREGVCHTGER